MYYRLEILYNKGFLMVSSSPLTRSSYHVGDDFAKIKSKIRKKPLAILI